MKTPRILIEEKKNTNLKYYVNEVEIKKKKEPENKISTLRKSQTKQQPGIPIPPIATIPANRSKVTQVIPSIDNFSEFKQWLLEKMAQLESLELSKTKGELLF